MAMQNPFENQAFSMVNLTRGIIILPNNYGRLNQMLLFNPQPVTQRTILVEEAAGVLNLLKTMELGAPGSVGTNEARTVRSFVVPHIPHDDVVTAGEVQGVRAFGTENQLETVAAVVGRKLQAMRNKHAITLEHLRMGAVKGIILDADASTLYDLYAEFGITQKVIDFDFAGAGVPRDQTLEAVRHIEDNLKGEVMTGVHCLCSEGFFDALVGHADVEAAYARWRDGEALREDVRTAFRWQGVTFEEYRGTATDGAGNTRAFIAADEAHMFPVGTMSAFETYFAPADFNETVNTPGLELYAKQEPRKFGRGTDIHTQSNPLPLCRRPGVLVKCTVT